MVNFLSSLILFSSSIITVFLNRFFYLHLLFLDKRALSLIIFLNRSGSFCNNFFIAYSLLINSKSIKFFKPFNICHVIIFCLHFLGLHHMHFGNKISFTFCILDSLLCSFFFFSKFCQSGFNLFLIMCHHFKIIFSFHHLCR